MKPDKRLIFYSALLLLLGALVWWLKIARFTHRNDGGNLSSSNDVTTSKPAKHTPAIADRTSPHTVSNGNASPLKQYSEMSIEEGRTVVDEIEKKDMDAILNHFLHAGRIEHDSMKQMAIHLVLSDELRGRKPNQAFLKKLQKFIESDTPSKFERDMMIGVLGQASTKETGELLLNLATAMKNIEMRKSAIGSVANLVREAGDETLAPALSRTWTETTDPDLMSSAAKAMGRTGAVSSVELLLAAALAPEGKDDERREAAMFGLGLVWTENAVPPLATLLEKSPVGSKASELAFAVLMQIGDKEGSQAVLKWLQKADSAAVPMAKAWIENARGSLEVKPMEAALDPKVPFRSEENRKALREGIEAYRASRPKTIKPK